MTRALANEVGDDGICVNAIASGLTISEGVQKNPCYSEKSCKMAASGRCFKRNQNSDDLVGTVLFLASDESDFITGQTIIADGGSAFH